MDSEEDARAAIAGFGWRTVDLFAPQFVGLLTLAEHVRKSRRMDIIALLDAALPNALWPAQPPAATSLALLRERPCRVDGLDLDERALRDLMCKAIVYCHCDIIETLLECPVDDNGAVAKSLYKAYRPQLAGLYHRLVPAFPPRSKASIGNILNDGDLYRVVLPHVDASAVDFHGNLGRVKSTARINELAQDGYNFARIEILHQAAAMNASYDVLQDLIQRCGGFGPPQLAKRLGFFWALCATNEEKRQLRRTDPCAEVMIMGKYGRPFVTPIDPDDLVGAFVTSRISESFLVAYSELTDGMREEVLAILNVSLPIIEGLLALKLANLSRRGVIE